MGKSLLSIAALLCTLDNDHGIEIRRLVLTADFGFYFLVKDQNELAGIDVVVVNTIDILLQLLSG